MTRRRFVPAAAAAFAAAADAAPSGNAIIELRTIKLRNTEDNQRQRTVDFLEHSAMPAMLRAGAGPIGVFTGVIAPSGPFLLSLASYPSLAAMEEIRAKVTGDSQ